MLLAVDQGTTSTKAVLVNAQAQIVAVSSGMPIEARYPRPGWVEYDPQTLLASVKDAARAVLSEAGVSASSVNAFCLANQGETVIAFDRRTGEALAPAMSWQDRRSASIAEQWRQRGLQSQVRTTTGLRIDSYFSASKLRWLIENNDAVRSAAERGTLAWGTTDSWLLWHLTRGEAFVTDVATASRTMLLDLAKQRWATKLLDAFDLPAAAFAKLVVNDAVVGQLDAGVVGATIPIAGLCVDQHAALFGQRCFTAGQAKATYGTGCFWLANAGSNAARRADGLISALGWQVAGQCTFVLEGGVYSAGSMVEWAIELGLLECAADLDQLVTSVEDTGGVALLPAFSGLAAPHWDDEASAAWIGMRSGTTRAHLVRAIVDAIAYRVREIVDSARASGVELHDLRVDGGLTQGHYLMQRQSDLLGLSVSVADSPQVTALGVALIGGLAVGMWDGVEQIPPPAAASATYQVQSVDNAERDFRRWQDQIAALLRCRDNDG